MSPIPFRLIAAVSVATLAIAATAQKPATAASHHATSTPGAAATTHLPSIKYVKYTLPNGLTVLTHEDHRLPIVAVDLWYHVGPLNERPGRTGFAHLFEHMMFEGSEHVGEKAHIKDVQGAGATDVNGTTSFDRTNYFETLPANQLDLGLWLESDRMGFLMEGLNRTLLANQRDVVRNERRQGEGRPYDLGEEAMMHQLFPKAHPYYGNVIGSHADVEAARIADVRDFHQQFYTPNNASLAIVGDFNPVKLRALLMKYFGPIPKGPAAPPVTATTPAITSQRRETVTDTVTLPQLKMAWLTPAVFTKDAYSVDVTAHALGGGKASRLDKALVLDRQLAQSVRCGNESEKLTGWFSCSITAKPGVKLETIEPIVWEEIAKLQNEGPTAEEVKAAKATELSRKVIGLQRFGGFGGVADTLNEYNQYTGDPGYLPKDVAAMQAVTAGEAKNAAVKYLTKDSAVVILTVPGKKVLDDVARSPENTDADVKITNPYSEAFETAQNWRKAKPAAGPTVTVHLPVPLKTSLPNGLTVMVVPDHTLPVVSVVLTSRGGLSTSTADKAGLPYLTMRTLGEATEKLNVSDFASAQEVLGTRIGAGISMDSASVTATFLTQYTPEAMTLFADDVRHPAFAASDFDRLKKQTLIGIQQSSDNVSSMASRVGPRLVYGNTAYGLPTDGTMDSVKGLTRDDAMAFYKAHIGPSNSALIFAGDVTLEQAKAWAAKYFGDWNAPVTETASNVGPAATRPTYVAIVDKPGAPQTALLVYAPGVSANSPDLPAVNVMNYVLGGSFASRINMNLREVHGYTYGANSRFSPYASGGTFTSGGLIRTNATGDAAREMMGEMTGFATHPATDVELKEAKDASILSLPGQFETTAVEAGAMSSIFIYNRPLNYYATLPDRYRAVTADDVARVAKENLHPGQLVIVAAGDRKIIEEDLKKQNLGPIEIVDLQGQAK